MSLTAALTTTLRWKMFVYKVISGGLLQALLVLTAALQSNDWKQLSGTAHFLVISAALIAVIKNTDSLVDKTYSESTNGGDAPPPPKPP